MNSILQHPAADLFVADSGRGNLDLKAYIAAVVGPRRIAFGSTRVVGLVSANGVLLSSNSPQSMQAAFVSVSLVGSDVVTRVALFSNDASVGQNAVPSQLTNTPGIGAGLAFQQVLLPSDSLYARSGVGQGPFDVVVSTSYF